MEISGFLPADLTSTIFCFYKKQRTLFLTEKMNTKDFQNALVTSENTYLGILIQLFTKFSLLSAFKLDPQLKSALAEQTAKLGLMDGYQKLGKQCALEHDIDVDLFGFVYGSGVIAFQQAVPKLLDTLDKAFARKTSLANHNSTPSTSTQKATDNTSTNMEILPIPKTQVHQSESTPLPEIVKTDSVQEPMDEDVSFTKVLTKREKKN